MKKNYSTIWIWTKRKTNRLQYTLGVIFNEVLGVEFHVETDWEKFNDFHGPKIIYDQHKTADSVVSVHPEPLLFELGINEVEPHFGEVADMKVIFHQAQNIAFPFDVFAATFFMVSRYEEYLPHKRDIHDRFDAEESIAYKYNFLDQAIVHHWCRYLWKKITAYHPLIHYRERKYNFVLSIDVDNAYAYLEKGLVRTIASILKDLIKRNIPNLKQRFLTLTNKIKDPYDTFDYQINLIKHKKLEVIYFFLLGDYGSYDKNVSVNSNKLKSLIKSLADYALIGIHPSYQSNNSFKQLEKEVNRLAEITHQDVSHSRQHYLKLKLPDTYRNLLELDVLNDYTMGFANYFGFRAGMCVPYNFYDLDYEKETCLRINSFAFMEGTFVDYLKTNPEEALVQIKKLIDEVREVNGVFISLWHNHTIQKKPTWKAWNHVFEEMIAYGKT